MTTNEAFLNFKGALELPERSQNAAATAQQSLRALLATKIEISDSFLSGSYARHTKIHPLNDIDVVLGTASE